MKRSITFLVPALIAILFALRFISCQENSTELSNKNTVTTPADLKKVSDGGITPVTYTDLGPGGNVSCSDLGGFDFSSGRINYNKETGEFDAPFPEGLEVIVTDNTYVSWSFSGHCELIVIVKGGKGSNVFTYTSLFTNDAGLAAPENASGKPAGLSNVTFCWNECSSIEGCTPGYWKNHTDSWPPTGYSPSQTIGSVFSNSSVYPALASSTLLNALAFGGGSGNEGGAEILLRAAVAALLNASHPGVDYPRTPAQVIAAVNTALTGSRDTMLALAAALDADNNLGCPLN